MTFAPYSLPKLHVFTVLLLCACNLLFSCHKDHPVVIPGPASRQQYDLNISYGKDANKIVTVYLTIYVNGVPLQVAFDTGSSGLRILQGAVAGVFFDTANLPVSYGYGDGTKADNLGIKGIVANANFSLGSTIPTVKIPVMLIQSAEIDSNSWFSTSSLTTLSGAYRNKNGLIGVGFRLYNTSEGIGSPLAQLAGGGCFIVSLPKYQGTKGELIINPTATDIAGFQTIQLDSLPYHLPNGYQAWKDSLRATTWLSGIPYQQQTLLDIGNPLIWLHNPSFKTRDTLTAGKTVRLQIDPPTLADTSFTVEKKFSGLDLVETNNGPVKSSYGIQFFFEYDVLYDPKKGMIGIRKKNN